MKSSRSTSGPNSQYGISTQQTLCLVLIIIRTISHAQVEASQWNPSLCLLTFRSNYVTVTRPLSNLLLIGPTGWRSVLTQTTGVSSTIADRATLNLLLFSLSILIPKTLISCSGAIMIIAILPLIGTTPQHLPRHNTNSTIAYKWQETNMNWTMEALLGISIAKRQAHGNTRAQQTNPKQPLQLSVYENHPTTLYISLFIHNTYLIFKKKRKFYTLNSFDIFF